MTRRALLALGPLMPRLARAQQCDTCKDRTDLATANAAWNELREGNARFAKGNRRGGAAAGDDCRRACTTADQKPFAIVLSCADSRVPPEMLFDQRIGDVFVIRIAGNVASDEAIASIEYAVEHLHDPRIVVVLGHQGCGAVKAALSPSSAEGMIPSILNRLYPSVKSFSEKDLQPAIEQCIRDTVSLLPRYSPVIAKFAKDRSGGPRIRGACYHLDKGEVAWL